MSTVLKILAAIFQERRARKSEGMNMQKWKTLVASKNEISQIDKKLGAFNQAMLFFEGDSEKRLAYVIKEDEEIIAGISACIDWAFIVHIELLFVDEKYRKQGIGSFL